MLSQEQQCCFCHNPFTLQSQPRLMPQCSHNSCTSCLLQLLSVQPSKIICQLCLQEESICQNDIQQFPKNIKLIKELKSRKTSSQGRLKSQTNIIEATEASESTQLFFYTEHKKEREILCLKDKVRICPHCALFSEHRDHQLKTVREAEQLIQKTQESFEAYNRRKVELDRKLLSPEFRNTIVHKISQHKNELLDSIKKKYAQLHQNLRLAEKSTYDDVAKRFKTINQKITELMKQENQHHKQYRLWQLRCKQVFQKAQKCQLLQQKVPYYFQGSLSLFKDGERLLDNIEVNTTANQQNIMNLISRIKIVDNPNISNSLFNYINVVIEDQEQLQVKGYIGYQVISPRICKGQSINQFLELSIDQLNKEEETQVTRHSIPSPKKYCSTKQSTPLNKSRVSDKSIRKVPSHTQLVQLPNVQQIVADFCQKNNQDTLDLSNQGLCDIQIIEFLKFVKTMKKIRGLKLVKNKLTTDGLSKLLDLLPSATNLNFSYNNLTDDAVRLFLSIRQKIPHLRIVNLSNNKINERRAKTVIDQLKRQGLIVTI